MRRRALRCRLSSVAFGNAVVFCLAIVAVTSFATRGHAVEAATGKPAAVAPSSSIAADPVRLVPPMADVVIRIERPRAIADLVTSMATRPELQGFRGYRDYIDSTNYQLFRQLVAHFEKTLGRSWPELLDDVAGGGVAIALKVQKNAPPPTLAILQGRDSARSGKFFQALMEVARQERERQGLPAGYDKESYRGNDVWKVGDDLYAAVLGDAIVYGNMSLAMHMAIDQHLDATKPSLLQEKSYAYGRKLVPDDALASIWVKLDFVQASPELKPLLALPSSFFPPQLLFGGFIDALKRSPYLVVTLRQEGSELRLGVRLPSGTSGMHEFVRVHAPPEWQPGALPLLEPDGVLFSTSYYLDLPTLWKDRTILLPSDQMKGLNDFEGKSAGVLYGKPIGWFFDHAGARQRIVVAHKTNTGYKITPKQAVPAFAIVMQSPSAEEFAQAIDGPIRGLAFLGQLQYSMTPIEEQHGGAKLIGYRFVENDANKYLGDGYLFNFSPCRARLGDQFIISSTKELAEQLIDELGKQSLEKIGHEPYATQLSSFTWHGLTRYLDGIRKQLVTQNMLEQGNGPADAAKEVSLFLNLLDRLGRVEMTNRYEPGQYDIDVRFTPN
jgi:hypothetical protein